MPLIRKTGDASPPAAQDARLVLQALASPAGEDRWMAARAAADVEGADAALCQALRAETDVRVREAMFTSLARIGTPMAVEFLLSMLRSDSAALRTGALDALRMLRNSGAVASQLLRDADPDVRILSCELARLLPAAEASRLLCELITAEQNVNVCAAAIDVLAEVGGAEALGTLADCARRFPDAPFLRFAIIAVSDRINVKSASARD